MKRKNDWVQQTIDYAHHKYGELHGGVTDLDENALIREMCKVDGVNHYNYWCQICRQDTFDPLIDFSTHPETKKILDTHTFLTISPKSRRYICRKCKVPKDKFWGWETCPDDLRPKKNEAL